MEQERETKEWTKTWASLQHKLVQVGNMEVLLSCLVGTSAQPVLGSTLLGSTIHKIEISLHSTIFYTF